jgi:GT2 family glycosyltransferase
MKNKTLSVLMTCYNRRETTLDCLTTLFKSLHDYPINSQVYLVDDGCTDGTAAAVCDAFPSVEILHGTGQLYWGGGMRMAFSRAMEKGYDYYLWLNDDTHLYTDAIHTLFATMDQITQQRGREPIVVGATRDEVTRKLSYGGYRRVNNIFRKKLDKVELAGKPLAIDTMNGNCVLIPQSVASEIGNIDPVFTHSIGDVDYGFRTKKAKYEIWLAADYIGSCALNKEKRVLYNEKVSLHDNWKNLMGPRGFPPREWFVYAKRHTGILWPYYWLSPYLKFLLEVVGKKIQRQTDCGN